MKIDDSNREYSESEVKSYIKGLNARIANAEIIHAEAQRIAEGVIDELKKENAELKEKNMMLELDLGEVNEVIGDSMKAISENQKLKQMLKTVADDIEKHRKKAKENRCVMGCVEECLFYNYGRDSCEYAHMTEIKKLIGEENGIQSIK